MSFPTVAGRAVEGTPFREAQSCLTPAFATSTYKFFLANTTTPANVYEDGALTTPFPITGQVTSDNYGRFPPIYLDPSVAYKVQFYDKTNTLRWTQNPYYSQLSTVGTSLLSAYGMRIATTGEVTIPAPNTGGSGTSLTLKAGALGTYALQITGSLPGNSAIIVNNSATTGAQTATFTATNKPGTATSSPGGWLPITCDGVQYYAPLWHGNNFTPYVASPSALGETIVGSSVTFGGTGLTTVVGGTATPSNWFSPTFSGVGANYYINITKTSGLSAVNFSAAQGAWTNIGSGGLTITSNAQAQITGTYQISSSVSGSPVVANGTITLSGNNGVQSPTYNGAANLVLAGNGTATLNGVSASNWYSPTTANVGASYWINITQTGGSSGTTFSAASGVWTNITNAGLTIGLTGGTGLINATGTYIIASDSGGVNQLGSGTITLNGGTLVQSPNWSGTTPLNLAGNGSATLNGSATSSWYSPNASNVGSGYWINITRTGGTSGVNFSAAQGSWTNITNSGLSIGISGYTGDVGTVSASGTYQISSSASGTPVLGSGTITLSLSGLTLTRTYTSGTSATETVPTGASNVYIEALGGGGGGNSLGSPSVFGANGGGGGFCSRSIAVTAGQTMTYTVGAGATAVGPASTAGGNAGTSSTVTGTVTGGTLNINAGGGQGGVYGGGVATGGSGGSATGGTTNTIGNTGGVGAGSTGGNGISGTYVTGGTGGAITTSSTANGGNGGNYGAGSGAGEGNGTSSSGVGSGGQIVFHYT